MTENDEQIKWLVDDEDYYYPMTASDEPKAAAQEYFEDHDDLESITVKQYKVLDTAKMLPDNLFGGFLETLAESLCDQYSEGSESEMLDSLYFKPKGEPNKAHEEVDALLRSAFEQWWRTYAEGFGVHNYYVATGQEMTFTAEELRH